MWYDVLCHSEDRCNYSIMIGHIPSHFIVLQDTTHVRILYSLDRVCAVFLSCVLKYMGLYHT